MVTLPQCQYSEDQALSRFSCQKTCLKHCSQPRKLVPTAPFRITWLPGIPTPPFLSLSRQTMGRVFRFVLFLGMNVNRRSTLRHVRATHECARSEKSPWSCGAVDLRQPRALEAFVQSLFCYLAPLSARHCETTRAGSARDAARLNVLAIVVIAVNAFSRLENITYLLPLSSPGSTRACLYYLTEEALWTEAGDRCCNIS